MKLWRHPYIYASARAERVLAGIHPRDVRSVAVIKHAALGDLVLARPFLTTVRKHFPNARITFGAIANYLNGVPEDLVDRVHVAAGQFRPRPPFRERLRSYRELGPHDLLFDITASSASMWITALNPARIKVGYRHHPLARFVYDIAVPRHIFRFEAENFTDALAVLRVPCDWPPDFGYPPRTAREDPPYLLYFPTASTSVKCWPAASYAALLGRLAGALPGHEHRVLYGVGDWEVARGDETLAGGAGRPNVTAVRDARGEAFRELIRGATLLICNDTGVRNQAIALGTPTLGVFTIGMVLTYLPRFGHHAAVHDPQGDEPSVDAVHEAARRLLDAIARDAGR